MGRKTRLCALFIAAVVVLAIGVPSALACGQIFGGCNKVTTWMFCNAASLSHCYTGQTGTVVCDYDGGYANAYCTSPDTTFGGGDYQCEITGNGGGLCPPPGFPEY